MEKTQVHRCSEQEGHLCRDSTIESIEQKEVWSVMMGAKMKGQLIFPGRIMEDYRKKFGIITGASRSLHRNNI